MQPFHLRVSATVMAVTKASSQGGPAGHAKGASGLFA